jgi:signal transduction histidine kinase
MLGIFPSLLRISQIEGNNRSLAFRSVNLAEIVDDVVELFDAPAEEWGCRINMRSRARALVSGDRDLLFDAIANLVDNAMKFDGEAARATAEVRYSSSSTPVPKRQQIMERIEDNPETAEQLADCLRTATRSRSACSHEKLRIKSERLP